VISEVAAGARINQRRWAKTSVPRSVVAAHRTAGELWRAQLRSISRRWGATRHVATAAGVFVARCVYRTDHPRWRRLAHDSPNSREYALKLARLVPPRSSVVAFGPREQLIGRCLDASCRCLRSATLDGSEESLSIDLNQTPLPDPSGSGMDTAVLDHVLERADDAPGVVEWLRKHFSYCVVSHRCAPDVRSRLTLTEYLARFQRGAISHYDAARLVAMFDRAGFSCIAQDTWCSGRIFVFVARRSGA
jgi:hypothetical protein